MSKVKNYLRGAALSVFSGVAFAANAYATDAGALMQSAEQQFSSAKDGIINIVKIGLVIAGLVTLVMAIINVVKGEREAAGKLAWWVLGIAIGFGFITILEGIS